VRGEDRDDVKETTLQTPRSAKKEGEGGAGDAGAESLLLQLVLKTMMRQAVSLQSMVEQITTCSPWKGPHDRAGGCLKEAVTPWGARAGAGSGQDLQTCGERTPRRSRFAGRACDPVGDPCWSSQFLKDCTPWKDTHWGSS